ncbi:3969_t:CDS:1 [Entrophospora sp. SA101]|nr:3969_t:CDS:1 [Entrophospora sp. SA101]
MDFLKNLPPELALRIVKYLDTSSMCKAAQVNKNWQNIIDGDKIIWKKRILSDGFNLEKSDEERAIHENWSIQNSIDSPLLHVLPSSTSHPYKEIYRRYYIIHKSFSGSDSETTSVASSVPWWEYN